MNRISIINNTIFTYPKNLIFVFDFLITILIKGYSLFKLDTLAMRLSVKYHEYDKLDYNGIVNNDNLAYKITNSFVQKNQKSLSDPILFKNVNIFIAKHWHLYYRLKDIINNGITIKNYYDKKQMKYSICLFFHPIIVNSLNRDYFKRIHYSILLSGVFNLTDYFIEFYRNIRSLIFTIINLKKTGDILSSADILYITAGNTSTTQMDLIKTRLKEERTNKILDITRIDSFDYLLSIKDIYNIWKQVYTLKKVIKKTNFHDFYQNDLISVDKVLFDYYIKACDFGFLKNIFLAEKIIEIIDPKLLFVQFDSNHLENVFVQICHNRNIRTISLQDGFGFREFGAFHIFSEYIIVSGNRIVDMYIKGGTMPENIKTLGRPLYDPFRSLVSRSKQNGMDDKIICFAPDPGGGSVPNEILEVEHATLLRLFSHLKNIKFIIKLHPQDKSSIWDNAIRFENIFIERNRNPYEIMLETDVWISMNSTTSIEACLFNNISIVYDPFNSSGLDYAINDGLLYKVTSHNELKYFITHIEEYSAFDNPDLLSNYFGKYETSSVDQISLFLSTLIN